MKAHSNHPLPLSGDSRFHSTHANRIGRVIIAFALAAFLGASVAHGAIRTVTKDTDNDPSNVANAGELRREINLATAGDTIAFDAAFFSVPRTILLHPTLYGPLFITKNLIVAGPGPAKLAVDAGGVSNRVFTVGGGPAISVSISGMTVTNGSAAPEPLPSSDFQFRGGGILSFNTSLTLSNCWIVGNRASNTVYSIGLGGGVCSLGGPLQMINCIVSNNIAAGLVTTKGGGILASNTGAAVIVSNCVITANSAGPGAGAPITSIVLGGGLAVEGANLTVTDCALSNNLAQAGSLPGSVARGGGFYGTSLLPLRLTRDTVAGNTASGNITLGGGVVLSNSTLSVLQNCTISGNSLLGASAASGGGGIFGVCAATNCTVVSNSVAAGAGGGLASGTTITLKNTLVAGNSAPADADVVGTFLSLGHNLVGQTNSVSAFTAAGDLAGTSASPIDPRLGTLADNGGKTWTHALLAGSPAIDTGDNAGAPSTDQRGFPRPGGSSTTVDIGAYESSFAGVPLTILCGSDLGTATLGCDTTRTLFIPANLTPPGYYGGSGPGTLKVKFEGEALDYAAPSSLTFPVGVTNLIWTVTAGAESVSCTQQVTVVQGVNQSPTLTLQPPAPTALVTNTSKTVTLVVGDADTINLTSLGVSSSAGGLVTLLSSGPDGSGHYSLTITAGSVTGGETITNIVTDACGATATNIFTVQVAVPPTISDIPNQTIITSNLMTLTVPFRVTGSGTLNVGAITTVPPAIFIPGLGLASFLASTPSFAGGGSDRSITETLVAPIPLPDYPPAYPANFGVTVTVTNDDTLTASDSFTITVVYATDTDGITSGVEDGAPTSGDGNSDGIQDSIQSEVASLPAAVSPNWYVTIAVTNGLRLVNVQALTPPTPLPPDAVFPQGLIQFRLEGLPALGASVTVTQIFQGGLSSGMTFYKYGSPTPGAAAAYYPFMYNPPGSPTGAEIISAENKIILHLKDGALGDDDWTENGVIIEPGGPAAAALPLTIQCATALETTTIGCTATRTLSIPANLKPPTYSGGNGPGTLKVKFEGEALDYAVPASLTFAVGVTNLVWTVTAGAESVGCTQQVAVIQGVNQSPAIAPLAPPPSVLATNASMIITLVVSDLETADPATLAVNSSSSGLVTLVSSGPDGSGHYSLTTTAGSIVGTETITNIVTDGCGATATNIFSVQVFQPLAMQCAAPLEAATIGCDTTRTLSIPANLTPPTYSGGSGPGTLKVKFEGEVVNYAVPASLTFPAGVTNLVWTVTAGAESLSCTQRVTVVQGVNQSPSIVPLSPPPTTLTTNISTSVTLVVSDAETANSAALLVNSSSSGLVTLLSSGPDVAGNYSLTLTAGTITGADTITTIVTDACGATATNTFSLEVMGPVGLSISRLTVTEAQIFWPVTAGALVLQYTDSLVPPITWQRDNHILITNGLLKSVTVNLLNGTRFYSLGPQ